MEIALYGAGMVAMSICRAIKVLYERCRIVCFLVSEKEGNPEMIDNIPVISLKEFMNSGSFGKEGILCTDMKILIAAPENHHQAIITELEKQRLRDYIPIDSRAEAKLMERYYDKIKQFPSLHAYGFNGTRILRDIHMDVYMARSHKDRPLKNPYVFPHWLHPIQAGAALAEARIADLGDDMGENISEKNGNYSELSALYWVWKNRGGKMGRDKDGGGRAKGGTYLGLFHYRRILDMAEGDLCRIGENDIDVVLPYPTIHYPSADEHHRRYVKDCDWEAMVWALEETAPEYGRSLEKVISQAYFYNYNIFIAKERVFKEFCAWLFPILKRTEELSTPKGWERSDRYIGYLGENLTTLYFMHHQSDLKIAHAGRLMLL